MKHELKKYLFDIKTSILSVFEYLGEERNFLDFQKDKLLRRGIEREIEIIGEAMNRILKIDPSITIKNSRKIVDTRNWVIHSYDSVDEIIIWEIVNNHLPGLLNEITNLLETE